MKKTMIKTAAACGLCVTLLAVPIAAAFGGGQFGQPDGQTEPPTSGAPMTPGGQQNPGVTYADEPTTVAVGETTNSAASLTANYGDAVTYDVGETGSVKIKSAGTYIVTGVCADGNITVAKGTTGVVLILKDLDLTSTGGAALSVNKNAEAKIIVAGSVKLTDAEDPNDENSADADTADAYDGAAIKIKDGASAYITGTGTLTINGSAKNGIKAGDETALVIDGPTLNITASNDAINGNYDVAILSGAVNISAGDDGIHADRILTIGTTSTSPIVRITESCEGLEGTVVNIAGGRVDIKASDDGVNAANSDGTYASELAFSINIMGGSVTVNAGFDGLDSNGSINLIAGSATINSANAGGDAGIDYDVSLYVSDEFDLNNHSGVAGPDNMMGGGMGMPGRQGQMTPPAQGGSNQQGQMTPPAQGWNDQQGQPTPPAQGGNNQQETPKATRSTQHLAVNGVNQNAEAYNIDGHNYFKLRDVAMLLNGTGSQFSVTYDAATRTIFAETGAAYTPVGGELQTGEDRSASCTRSTQALIVNGRRVELTAYMFGGNNYFQLRELGAVLGFDVDYDEATRTMLVVSR
ncbi:MAG: carbohydrate-binding domain-containing protein [Oscillospiraceae bacterium]|nr:carbohydrate-binding domain-containing protein [Oscillospiraceae bacterium]